MPAVPIARTTSANPPSTIIEVIGATTRSAFEDSRHVQLGASWSHQPQLQYRHSQHLHARDPGASNAQLGGAIVASVTGSILIVVFLCLCCRRGAKSPTSSPDSSSTRGPSRPRRSPEVPAIVVNRLGPNKEVERSEPIWAYTRRKAPKAKAASWHSPPASTVYMEEAYFPPPVHR